MGGGTLLTAAHAASSVLNSTSPMSSTASVTSISPTSGAVTGGTLVTISGSGFTGATAVAFGTTQAQPTPVSDSTITVMTPAMTATGSVSVQVDVPTGLSPVNPNVSFDFVAATPVSAAVVTGVSPAFGPIAGGTVVTITGSGFAGATAVAFGAVQVPPSTVTDTEITVTTLSTATGGTVNVQVDVPTGLSPTNPSATYQFVPPSIASISPATGPDTGGTVVTIVGSYLSQALTVQFGGVAATSAPVIVSDSEITVVAPAASQTGAVGVQVNLPTGLVPSTASAGPQYTYVPPVPSTPVNATFVVINQTGVPDDLVYVKFLGADINASTVTQTYAGSKALKTGGETSSRSYSLHEMSSTLTTPALTAPNFALNDYTGGRIYFSVGLPLANTNPPAAQNPTDSDFSTVYGYVEPSVFPDAGAGSTNLDASYVDFVGLPISIAIKNAADGSLANPPANNPLTTPGGNTLFTALTAAGPNQVPAQTVVTANTSAQGSTGTVTIGGTARILSPSLYEPSLISGATPYHGWTGTGSLIAALRSGGATLQVASYVSTDATATVPKGTLFGFAGSSLATPPIAASWLAAQTYALTATAVADLNPQGANPRIPQLEGVSGIILAGSGGTVTDFSIYLTDTDLDAATGVYGANPPYVVDWTGQSSGPQAYSLAGIVNDLSGRVVGDLLAGFNFGWAACATTVAAQAASTNTAANLAGTVFDVSSGPLAQAAIGALSTGQFFYLLSLQPDTAAVAQWFGASIQPSQPTYYNNYASDFQSLTNAYNMAFTDRLQGASDPDMFFAPSPATYVEITLLPGAYTVTTTP